MACIQEREKKSHQQQLKNVRNEIACDLVTQMYAFAQRPDKRMCTMAAEKLTKKYPFMKDRMEDM